MDEWGNVVGAALSAGLRPSLGNGSPLPSFCAARIATGPTRSMYPIRNHLVQIEMAQTHHKWIQKNVPIQNTPLLT